MQAALENPFFRGLSPEQLDLIFPLFEPFTVPGGGTIFKQGDQATYLYVIQGGSVTIQYKPYDGPMITLSHLQAGEVFGWSSVVGAQSYTSDAISTTDVDLLRLRGSDLIRLCAEHPNAGVAILDRLAEAVSPRWTYARQQIQGILENLHLQRTAAHTDR
jgi:CRP-like cAMP-binding protein